MIGKQPLRLLSFSKIGDSAIKVGVLSESTNKIIDLSSLASNMRAFLSGGTTLLSKAQDALENTTPFDQYSREEVNVKAPIANPEKIICVGLNYRDHAIESGMDIPTEPVLFSKYPSCIIGPGEGIKFPQVGSSELDYEVEMVIVIGREGHNIPKDSALDYVAGYTIGHDVSLRDWQLKKPGGQWMLGKTFDTFAPIGPYIKTLGDSFNPHELNISCTLNGEVVQSSNTRELIFKTEDLLSYISRVVTLKPGDLIFTGTPPGVGFARDPPIYLKPGDNVVCEIEGIGKLLNPVVS